MENEIYFDKGAIELAKACVRYIKSVGKIVYGKTTLNYGKGEQFGNTPVEYSIIFEIDGKYFHFFTSDMRYTGRYGRRERFMTVRTCAGARDFHGDTNYWVDNANELREFVERKLAGKGVVYA